MTPRKLPVVLPLALVATLAGCVERGGWKSAPRLEPRSLTASQALAGAKIDAAAWPAEGWWRGLGDPQLDALVDEALAGSPSLEVAQARLRAAQGDAIAAGAARLPAGALDAETTRQRYPEHGLFPPPYAGSYVTDARLALDFSFEIDFWGRNRALLAAARSGVEAAEADRAAARLALTVAVARAYVQLDLWYQLLDVTNENLRQQSAILELTQQRVSAGLENTARVKQSEGNVALTRVGVASVEANIELARNQLADLAGAGPDRGQRLERPRLAPPSGIALPSALPADLLARRPDVAAARARVEAARAREHRAADCARGRTALLRSHERALSRRPRQLPERTREPESGDPGAGAARAAALAPPHFQRRPGARARRRLRPEPLAGLRRRTPHARLGSRRSR